MVSCAIVGASSVTACGAAFTEDTSDGGASGEPGSAITADSSDEGNGLEGSLVDATAPDVATHADATSDGGADGTTAIDGATAIDAMIGMDSTTGVDSTTGADSAIAMDSAIPDSPPDAPVLDACTLATATDANGTFVQQGGSGGLCTKAAPCGSITTAIGALGTRSTVYVAQGTYVEQVTLASNVLVQGGWLPGAWTRNCGSTNANATIVQAPSNANKTILANGVTNVTLDTLSVSSKAAANVAIGESIYGIFATGGSLTLTNVNVQVVKAGDGAAGAVGSTGSIGSNTCARTSASNGQGVGPGSGGSGASAGTFSSGGYAPANGGDGSTGATGNNGMAGVDALSQCANGTTCTYDGNTGLCFTDQPDQSCGTDGTEGCGGGPGGIGRGGGGGGSSVALFAWGATVVINGGSLASGNGGTGGDGGLGGTGGAGGGVGVAGQQGPQIVKTCKNNPPTCGGNTFVKGGAGGAGGTGGKGADGGRGGGGSGGSSYAYYFGGGAAVSPSGATMTFGSAGAGGTGANAGASGSSAQHN